MIKRIVVPLDGAIGSDRAIDVAAMFAHRSTVDVELFSLVSAGMEDIDSADLRYVGTQHPAVTSTKVIASDADVEASILTETDGDDLLLCLASSGRGALSELVNGSVSEGIVRASRRPVLMVGPRAESKPDANVLAVALDGSSASESILPYALALSRQFGFEILLISVQPPLHAGQDTPARLKLNGFEYLKRTASRYRTDGVLIGCEVLHSRYGVQGLVRYSKRSDVAAIAMATHGPGYLERLLLGGTTFQTVKRAGCPVLTVLASLESPRIITFGSGSHADAPDTAAGSGVVVGVGCDEADEVLRWAADLAVARGTSLRVVHAWELPASAGEATAEPVLFTPELQDAQLEATASRAVGRVHRSHPNLVVDALITTTSSPAAALLQAATEAQILVVGRRDNGSLVSDLLLGSVAAACARHSPCPILIVPNKPVSTG